MPYKVRAYPNSVPSVLSGSGGTGGFAIPLDRIPGTCTEMWIKVVANITASGATPNDDTWDRLISQMSLVYSTQNYFNFGDMTQAAAICRFKGLAGPRITFPSSPTTQNYTIWYPLHFGMVPYISDKVSGRLVHNPFDLSAGIPQLPANSLQLTGNFGGSTALAPSGVTVNNCYIQPYFTYITNLPNESPDQFQPQAFPAWYSEGDTQYATTAAGAFGNNVPLPIGDWIQAALMTTRANTNTTNNRSDAVLTNMQFYDQTGQRKIFSFNTWNDFVAFTQFSRMGYDAGAPPSDGPTAGTVAYPPSNVPYTVKDLIGNFQNTMFSSTGLAYVDMRDWISQPDPTLGLNMDPSVNPYTQLQWQLGSNGTVNTAFTILYLKYKKNAAASAPAANLHPAVAKALMSGG